MQQKFQFLPQAGPIRALLNAACISLESLDQDHKSLMVEAMQAFEVSASPTMWSVGDIAENLDTEEKLDALQRFVMRYECKEADWYALEAEARAVKAEREVRFKYHAAAAGASQGGAR